MTRRDPHPFFPDAAARTDDAPSDGPVGPAPGTEGSPDLAERLLTLPLRHPDVGHPDRFLLRVADDLAAELGVKVRVRPVDGLAAAPGAPAGLSLRIVVRGELVGHLDVDLDAPEGSDERRLLGHLVRLLGHRVSQLSKRDAARLLADLTLTLSLAEGLEDAVRPALDILLEHTHASAAVVLLRKNGELQVLGKTGEWPPEERELRRRLARVCMRGRQTVVARGGTVACRLGIEHPYRYAVVLRFPPKEPLLSLRWPGLRHVAATLSPHLESLWRERARGQLLKFHDGSWDHPTDDMYERLLDAAIQLVHGADSGSLAVRRSPDDPMVFRAVRGYDEQELRGVELPADEARVWYGADDPGWESGRPRVMRADEVNIAARSASSSPTLGGRDVGTDRIRSTLCLPVVHEGVVMAVLNLDNQHDVGAFGRDSRDIIELFGLPLAGLLHRQHTQDLLRKAALTDPLTGLNNRRPLGAALQREMARHRRTGTPVAILQMDLSRFKAINDDLGHEAGDEALVAVARALRGNVRETDVVARWGGDEFAAILVDSTASEAADAAERLTKAVESISIGGRRVAINIGWAVAPEDGVHEADLMRRADARMYDAKRRASQAR